MTLPGPYNPMIDVPGYFAAAGGLLLPKKALQESQNKNIQVSSGGYLQFFDVNLEMYARQQLAQSRKKWFVLFEMYRRSTWVRAATDWICNAALGVGPDQLVDPTNPANPEIEDIGNFLKQCHPTMSFTNFQTQWRQSLKIYGYGYAYIEPDNDGKPAALWPLDPRVTFPVTDQHGTIMFHAQVYNGRFVALMPEEVLYFALPNNNTEATPLSPLETIYDSVALNLNANAYNAALFQNDLNLGMVFSSKTATKEIVDENDRILRDKYSRPQNAGRHLILYGDMTLLRDGAAALKDINFQEMLNQCKTEACAVLGVPPFLLGAQDLSTRAAANVHERSTYVTTVRPLRQLINEQFTKQFIRGVWGSETVELQEPLASMLAHPEQIDAASKVADIGAGTFNEYRQLLGMPRVPNGDYPVMKIPGQGGFIRVDQTSMPGLLDPHFNFAAYVRAHEEEEQQNAALTQQGLQPQPGTPYVPPMSYDTPQDDPIAARIIDISRSLGSDGADFEWVVERRTPQVPGARGGRVYFTKTGKPRYGQQPTGAQKQAPALSPSGDPNQNTLTNPRDPNTPKRLTPDERAQVASARTQVQTLLGVAMDQNWTDEQFFSGMQNMGWDTVSGADHFTDVRDARAAAELLSERYPDNVYTLLGSGGQYQIMWKSLDAVAADMHSQDGAPSMGTPAVPSVNKVGRSLLTDQDEWDTWEEKVRAFLAS